MSEGTKAKLFKAVKATKHTLWKWIGSMFMELKPDRNGDMHQAMSLTRVLTLVCFLGCFGIWVIQKVDPPDMMTYTLWGLLGLKGLTNFKTSE